MAAPSVATDLGGNRIISARLLILQSKRMLLVRALSNVRYRRLPEPNDKVVRLQSEVQSAVDTYRDCVLKFGSVDSSQYWLVAFASLVEAAEMLSGVLVEAASSLPQPDRADVAVDARRLDGIIEGWRELLRTTVTTEVA